LTGKSRGSNRLLKEGAKLVECVEDVIEELAPQLTPMAARAPAAAPKTATTPAEMVDAAGIQRKNVQSVLDHLSPVERIHIDSIVESSGLNVQTVLGVLLELELTGIVAQHPGKLFSLAQI
jgi:DNA processing protein